MAINMKYFIHQLILIELLKKSLINYIFFGIKAKYTHKFKTCILTLSKFKQFIYTHSDNLLI